MAISYRSRKCTSCGGRLEYLKDKKLWQCIYCGAQIEREESYDGLFTVKNVARQTIVDLAFRRMESALINMSEAEKIDSKYIGTVIAKICSDMIRVTVAGLCTDSEARGLLADIRNCYGKLRESGGVIGEEEEIFYEFLESPDAWCTLLLVYDTLNDEDRKAYMEKLLEEDGNITSSECNKGFLGYAMKKGKYGIVDDIVKKHRNIDVTYALREVLRQYPDTKIKPEHVNKFLQEKSQPADKNIFEEYLEQSADACHTKAEVISYAYEAGVRPGMERLISSFFSQCSPEETEMLLRRVGSSKMNDQELYKLVEYAFTAEDVYKTITILNSLLDSGQYIVLGSKYIFAAAERKGCAVTERIRLLEACFRCKVESRTMENLFARYLCFGEEPEPEEREQLLDYLYTHTERISASSVESYVLQCVLDGLHKPQILRKLFDKSGNIALFRELPAAYLNQAKDEAEVKNAIMNLFDELGLSVTAESLEEYINTSSISVSEKVLFVRKAMDKGVRPGVYALNSYLTSLSVEEFSPELFQMLYINGAYISDGALCRYVLFCHDRSGVKVNNAVTLTGGNGQPFGTVNCRISHLGHTIDCCLLQAYILIGTDAYEVASELVRRMLADKAKINAPMIMDGKNAIKLKKYVQENRKYLSRLTDQLCTDFKVYTMLF